jgi:hypothetical protein
VTPPSKKRTGDGALVLGLLAMPFGIFSPFAIWAGIRALRRVRASDGAMRGEAFAWIGVVGGFLGLAVIGIGTAYWFLAS